MVNRARLNATSPKLEDDSSSVYSQDTITAGSWLAPGALVYPVYCHLSTSPPRSKGKHSSIVLSNLNYPLEIEPSMINSDEMEVNIRMKLRSADTDIERWRNWLLEAPAEAVGVSISVT